ncbi:MAG TPA: hypothetical protein PKD50_12460, partial [Leptospiraceae bacterium]|nr:hypothetical protein [Leptospiraceae bacterium]
NFKYIDHHYNSYISQSVQLKFKVIIEKLKKFLKNFQEFSLHIIWILFGVDSLKALRTLL